MKKVIEKNKKWIELFIIITIILVIYGFITSRIGLNIPLTLIATCFILLTSIKFGNEKLFDNIINKFYKFRWLIYLIIFIICLLFKVHGSSIGEYSNYFKEKIDDTTTTTLMGRSRAIRSDEYVVLTPYYISQTYNDFEKNSNMMSLTPQNMIIGYNAPVKDITVLAKPLDWGYMLLGKDYGLSWYWCMKLLLIFAFALECMHIITKNKELSIVGALLVTLGPSTQWWFAPHMPDVILWMMALLSTTYYYLSTDKRWLKNTLMIIVPFIVTEYAIALFPSFQVGLGIFALVMLILLIVRDKISLFKDKKQNIRHIVLFVLTILLLGYFVITNKEALLAVMNTAYPGARVVTGGDQPFSALFTDLTTIFLPYKDITYLNNCEVSTYIHFGFFIFLLYPVLAKAMKKENDRSIIIGRGMVIILIIYSLFMLIGFPEWLAKITFFSYINRMKMIAGLIAVFFTVWGFNAILKYRKNINSIYYVICSIIYCVINLFFITPALKEYMNSILYIIEILAFFIILMTLYFKWEKISLSLLLGLLLFSSITINPIVIGIKDIYNHPSASKIQEIVKEDKDSYWLGYDSIMTQSYIMMNGGKTINGVNFYPDKEKWEILDPEGTYDYEYNRYAHIYTYFTDKENDEKLIKSTNGDCVTLRINLQDLVDLKVKYIVARYPLERENSEYKLSEIYKDNDCRIYEIIKKD